MSLSTPHSVQPFLAAVEREASALPADRRQELLADLTEHIEVALSERPGQEKVILAELGDPRTIAALRVLLCVLIAIVVIAVIGIATGSYAGPAWLQTVSLLPALTSATHVFFLRPGRVVLRTTLTVTLGIYFAGEVVNVMRGASGAVIAVLLSATMLVLLHLRSTRIWFGGAAASRTTAGAVPTGFEVRR